MQESGFGVGKQGSGLVRSFAKIAQIGANSDVYLPRVEQLAKEVRADSIHQDYRGLLDRKDIDAVIVATPHHWHTLCCIHAAQAGKDIYCEKPLAYSIVEGRRVVQAVRKYQRVLQTGLQQRSGTTEYAGCMFVRNGALGRITRVIASKYSSPMEPEFPEQPVPEGLDWERWCGPAVEVYRSTNHHQNWLDCIRSRQDPAANVEIGQRTTSVCHLANIARWVSGLTGETGQKLRCDAVAERFTNSDEANEFLSRPARKGYELPETV